MAQSQRYVLTIQGLPNFNQPTPLQIVIPPGAGPQIAVEVNIPVEFLAQAEMFVSPAIASVQMATYNPMLPQSQQQTVQLGTPGFSNPPISSPLASPGQPANASSLQLASTPLPSSPGRQNSIDLPMPSTVQRTLTSQATASSAGNTPSSLRPAPIPTVSNMGLPQSYQQQATVPLSNLFLSTPSQIQVANRPTPSSTLPTGDAFRANPTLAAPTPSRLADVLRSPQMLAPASVQDWTAASQTTTRCSPEVDAFSQSRVAVGGQTRSTPSASELYSIQMLENLEEEDVQMEDDEKTAYIAQSWNEADEDERQYWEQEAATIAQPQSMATTMAASGTQIPASLLVRQYSL